MIRVGHRLPEQVGDFGLLGPSSICRLKGESLGD